MAIGDNIPSIFSNLAQSVIKSNGDPMYLMDQFEGRDADAEQQLRMGIMDGPPPPMEGSLLDQYLFATGDPNQATGMVINDIMARHDETVNMGYSAPPQQQQPQQTNQPQFPGQPQQRPQRVKPIKVEQKVGRNDECPCGSGRKYKKCHGRG